jgi:hypothetical protein
MTSSTPDLFLSLNENQLQDKNFTFTFNMTPFGQATFPSKTTLSLATQIDQITAGHVM